MTERARGIRDAHHLLELFGVAAPIEQAAPDAITATEGEKIDAPGNVRVFILRKSLIPTKVFEQNW
jgi:hypothetical protein